MQNTVTIHHQGARTRVLRQLLERHTTELSARKHDLRGLTGEGGSAVEDSESSMIREGRGLGAAMASISSRTVQLIEGAMLRLQAGTYGRCSDCRGEVPAARLRALPFADTCRDCQERRDQAPSTFPILV